MPILYLELQTQRDENEKQEKRQTRTGSNVMRYITAQPVLHDEPQLPGSSLRGYVCSIGHMAKCGQNARQNLRAVHGWERGQTILISQSSPMRR